MHLPPFALDHWLSAHDFADPPIAFNLASSTGPRWSVADLCALGDQPLDLGDVVLSYAPPAGTPALRSAIAAFHGVDPDMVVATTGASEALSILFCLAARPDAHILLPDPGYPAYEAVAGAWGLAARSYRLERDRGFAQDPDAILAHVDANTAMVIVNTPHNPSGSVMPRDTIARLATALAERGVPLLVDEVYHPLYFGPPQQSAAGLANVIVTSDLSKAHRAARTLRAGSVWVNQYDGGDMTAPFGGFKQSGNGRDKSLHAFDKYTELKATWIKL